MAVTWDEIETYRDHTYWRTPDRQVHDMAGALRFVNKVGFCFAFTARRSELPCLWHAACGERHPAYPEHTHSDPYVSLVWQAKDDLPAQRALYYGKAIKARPSMISLAFLPAFYRLVAGDRGEDGYIADYMAGQLSPAARHIMDALIEHSPQITSELKLSSGFAHPGKRAEFDRAMAELQMRMYLCKIAEFYDPFTFLWEQFHLRYAEEVKQAARMTQEEAREIILLQYFKVVGVASAIDIQRLFAWRPGDVAHNLARLQEREKIVVTQVQGEKKTWYQSSDMVHPGVSQGEPLAHPVLKLF